MRRRVGWESSASVLAVLVGRRVVAAVSVTAASGAHRAAPGVTATEDQDRRHVPAHRGRVALQDDSGSREGVLRLRQRHTAASTGGRSTSILDDAYDPSKTVPLVQQLVEQDKVFAVVGSLGTAPGLATWGYLNSHKVPQVLLATGDSYWGFSGAKKYPWTMGWQPDYPGEAKLYGKYIAQNMPTAKIGVLFQNDAYGKNYYAGLRVGLGAKKSNIVSAQSYDATHDERRAAGPRAEGRGRDVFVVFARRRRPSVRSSRRRRSAGRPTATFINNVSANPVFLMIAAANGGDRQRRHLDELHQRRHDGQRADGGHRSSRRRSSPSTRLRSTLKATRTSSTGSVPRGRSCTH